MLLISILRTRELADKVEIGVAAQVIDEAAAGRPASLVRPRSAVVRRDPEPGDEGLVEDVAVGPGGRAGRGPVRVAVGVDRDAHPGVVADCDLGERRELVDVVHNYYAYSNDLQL